MPELPEVETVRATLAPRWVGRTVATVDLRRTDIVRAGPTRGRRAALGQGAAVFDILRHGKQLAVVFDSGCVAHIHLGMSGQMLALAPDQRPPKTDHIHCRWRLDDGSVVCFRDPRRFGGLWLFRSLEELHRDRWDALGPDALTITTRQLREGLGATTRAIKAALLDQTVLAGVGNIYADEALFRARINPHTPTHLLRPKEVHRLAESVRTTLRAAVRARGSSLRDYVDADLNKGRQQDRFRVYARAGQDCTRCGSQLLPSLVAQRSTTHCPLCQPVDRVPDPG